MLRPGFFQANTVVFPTSELHDEQLIERLAILESPRNRHHQRIPVSKNWLAHTGF